MDYFQYLPSAPVIEIAFEKLGRKNNLYSETQLNTTLSVYKPLRLKESFKKDYMMTLIT